MTTLAILTCQRKTDYLARTLASLGDTSAFERRLIWCDGPVTLPPAAHGWEVGGKPERQGPPNTFAFWDMLEAVEGDGDLLFLEDDVEASPGALAYIRRMGCPEPCTFVSWYDPICRLPWNVERPAVRYINSGEIVGCPARTFPAAAVRELVAFRDSPRWAPHGGSDHAVAVATNGLCAAVHTPSLFQHIGDVSEISASSMHGIRTSKSWMGPGFDVDFQFEHVSRPQLWAPMRV